MESQGLLDYVIKVTASGASVYIGQSLVCGRRNPPPQAPAPSLILISSVILSLISHYYRVILPQYAAIVLSFHISHSDIAFVVKFRFCEGLSEMWGGAGLQPPNPGPPPARRKPGASRPLFQHIFIYLWTVYLGSIVKCNAFYEYCGLLWRSAMRVGGEDICGWRYDDRK